MHVQKEQNCASAERAKLYNSHIMHHYKMYSASTVQYIHMWDKVCSKRDNSENKGGMLENNTFIWTGVKQMFTKII